MIQQNRIIRFLFILLTVICSVQAFAGVEPYQNQLKGKLKKGDSLIVKDEKFRNVLFDWNEITNRTVKNYLSLQITHDTPVVLNKAFTCELDLKVEYFSTPDQAEPISINSVKLKVNFTPDTGGTYKAKDVYEFSNGYYVKVTVNNISSPELGENIPPVLQLSSQIVIDRQYAFHPEKKINFTGIMETGSTTAAVTNGNARMMSLMWADPDDKTELTNYFLKLFWQHIQGAEEYDIEWAVFDELSEHTPLINQVLNNQITDDRVLDVLFRNNATRVTTAANNYNITMVYNAKYIMVRMRQVQYQAGGYRWGGSWDYRVDANIAIWPIKDWHEQNLNWQYSATFAEEGKKKEVVSYFDGSLRSRQMVTINNSDKVAVVQESVYDEFGRAAANILPAPTEDDKFHFYPKFNTSSTGAAYNYLNIQKHSDNSNVNGENCEVLPDPLSEATGAAKYYSPSNPWLDEQHTLYRKYNKYIPKANGYPIAVTQFTNDNTGRVRVQGGVGPAFQPGADNHVTKYYYGKPEIWELDRLFGNDVGYAHHYQKNMVVDPNGQISISYLNSSGKTIATALTGEQPDGMDALPSKPEVGPTTKKETITILRPQQFVFDATALSLKARTTYTASVLGAEAKFTYDLQKLIYNYQGSAFQVCSNCYYDLTIKVTNDCGGVVYTSGANPIPIGPLDGDCNATNLHTGEFDLTFNKIGEYYISFEYKLSKNVIDRYTEAYIKQRQDNGDMRTEMDFIFDYLKNINFEGCFNECSTCEAALGTEAQFTKAIIDQLKAHDYVDADFTAPLYSFINGLHTTLRNQCLALKATCMVSSCSKYEQQMLDDVSPGGQYALFTFDPYFRVIEEGINVISINWRNLGVFDKRLPSDADYIATSFSDENGKIISPYDKDFTLEMLVKYWQPEWAAKFLQFHPEKCKLDFCNANSNYIMWDDQVQQFINKAADIANIPGTTGLSYSYSNSAWLLENDPFFAPTAPGYAYRNEMQQDLNNFSSRVMKITTPNANVKGVAGVIDYMLYCADMAGTTNTDVSGDTWNNCSPLALCRVPDREWAQYKDIYFQLKQKYYQQLRNNGPCAGKCAVGKPVGLPSGSCPSTKDFTLQEATDKTTCVPGYTVRITYAGGKVKRPITVNLYYPTEFGDDGLVQSVTFAAGESEKLICLQQSGLVLSSVKIKSVVCSGEENNNNNCIAGGTTGQINLTGTVKQLSSNRFQQMASDGVQTTYTIVPGRFDQQPADSNYCPDGTTLVSKNFYNCLKVYLPGSSIAFQYTNVWVVSCNKSVCSNVVDYTFDQQIGQYTFYKNGNIYYVTLYPSGGVTPPCQQSSTYYPCLRITVPGNATPSFFQVASLTTCSECEIQAVRNVTEKVGDNPLTYRTTDGRYMYVYPNTDENYTPPVLPCSTSGTEDNTEFITCLFIQGMGEMGNQSFYNAKIIYCPAPCEETMDYYVSGQNSTYEFTTANSIITFSPNGTPDETPYVECSGSSELPVFRSCARVIWGNYEVLFHNVWVNICYPIWGGDITATSTASPMAALPPVDPGEDPEPYCPEAYTYKKPRFTDIDFNFNFTVQDMLNMQNENTVLINDQIKMNCEEQADKWISQLEGCLASNPNADALRAQLKAKLIEVCIKGGDLEHPYGSSTARPGETGTTSFKQAIIEVLGSNALSMTCNPWLIDEPHPYEPKQQAVSITLSNTNPSLCARLNALRVEANGANLYDYLKGKYGDAMNLTQTQLAMMVKSCDNCRYLVEEDIPLPVFMEPGTVGCINKTVYDNAKADLAAELNNNLPTDHENYPTILANYLNHRFGFSMAYFRYQEYETLLQQNTSAILCNNVPYVDVPVDQYVCLKSLVESAIINGQRDYLAYVEEEKRLFRLNYVARCSQAQASTRIKTVQQIYHYTLYYYDQAGNLIRTVSPEGVRFLSDEEMALVDGYRDNDEMIDCASLSTTATESKTAVFTKLSDALQSHTVQSLELWLNGTGTSRQVRFVTPDNKYMYQAAIKDSKLWVELYTLNPGANGGIEITLTNHATANLESSAIAEWSHLVVQASDFTGGAWDVYYNNKKLTLLPNASAPAYPFSWEIEAGFTLPAEEIAQLRHVRLYDQAMGIDNIAKHYVNACRAPEGQLAVQASPLIIWGRFNYPSTCNTNVATRTVNNRGALKASGDLGQSGKWFPNIINDFTVEFWVNPEEDHQKDFQLPIGASGTTGQKYVIYPEWGSNINQNRAGMGVSVGKNGVSVYEHADGYMPAVLVYDANMTGWHHVAIKYSGKIPYIYIDGVYKQHGVSGDKSEVSPSYNICSNTYGTMKGEVDELRIWDRALSAQEILANYNKSIVPSTSNGLVAYWPMSSADGANPLDITCAHLSLNLPNSNFSYSSGVPDVQDVIAADDVLPGVYPRHRLTTSYAFNSTGQVFLQKSPEGGSMYFWFDQLSRTIASQDEEQRSPHDNLVPNRYSYIKYEPLLGRVTEAGEKINGTSLPAPGFIDQSTIQTFLASGTNTQITSTVYDQLPTGNGVTTGLLQDNLSKRISATLYRETDGSPVLQGTYYSYDLIGKVKSIWQQVEGLGLKKIDYEYDLASGKTNFVRYQDGQNDQFYYAYKYDAENRLVQAATSTTATISDRGSKLSNEKVDALYQYYLHGLLARTELGPDVNKVQGLDYAYTLQGWIKGVNGHKLNATTEMGNDGVSATYPARDAMAYAIGYYNYDYEPIGGTIANAFSMKYSSTNGDISGNNLYNGNISNATVALNRLRNGDPVGYTYRYDQLNRLKAMRYHPLSASTTDWNITSKDALDTYGENINYDGNGNILKYVRNGANTASMPLAMDKLTYNYKKEIDAVNNQEYLVHNQLQQVEDDENLTTFYSKTSNGIEDIDNQTKSDNYQYDKIGNLVSDEASYINKISWNAYGKIKSISKNVGGIQTEILYSYDATGNKIRKSISTNGQITSTWYTRDAQGNIMAVYSDKQSDQPGTWWQEQHLYGSSRLGIWNPNINIATTAGTGQWGILGKKQYELTNHLGNVLTTITDKTIGVSSTANGSLIDYFEADVVSAQDYYPFGMLQPGRNFNVSGYRFGFNGKENDNEVKGDGNQLDFGARIYDPRTGRFLSVDPLTENYPWYSPYLYAGNMPVRFIDVEGMGSGDPQSASGKGTYSGGIGTNLIETEERLATQVSKVSKWKKFGKFLGEVAKKSNVYVRTAEAAYDVYVLYQDYKEINAEIQRLEAKKKEAIHGMYNQMAKMRTKSQVVSGYEQHNNQDLSQLPDQYLAEVEKRINSGTATDQDRLYQNEIMRRKLLMGASASISDEKPTLHSFETSTLKISQTLETNHEMKVLRKLSKSVEATGINYDLEYGDQMQVFQYKGTNYLINGHHRLAVANKLGIKTIKAVIIDEHYLMKRYGITPEQAVGHSQRANEKGNKLRF